MSPVRVRRGRAAAYRSLWQWPLRTPARATATALAALALAAGLTALTAVGTTPPSTSPTAPTDTSRRSVLDNPTRQADEPSTPTGTGTGTAAPGGDAPTSASSALPIPASATAAAPPAPAEPTSDPTGVARTWTTRWLDTQQPVTAWLDGLAPYTTEEYLGLLSSVDTTALPDGGTITGDPITVSTTASSATIDIPTTSLQLRLTLIETPDGWRVANSDRSS